MAIKILPVNAAETSHPMANHYRDTRKARDGVSALRKVLGRNQVLIVGWNKTEGTPDKQQGVVYPVLSQLSLFDALPDNKGRAQAFRALAEAWDCCTWHYPLEYFIAHDWDLVMTRSLVAFLAKDPGTPADIKGHQHDGRFIKYTEIDRSTYQDDFQLLPFVPLYEGRGSKHEDIAERSKQSSHVNLITGILGLAQEYTLLPAVNRKI